MPTPKTKPQAKSKRSISIQPAAVRPDPSDSQAWHAAAQERRDRLNRDAKVIDEALGDIDGHLLGLIRTVRLISSRTHCGMNGPVDKFIEGLLQRYQWAEDEGSGLTVEEIESEMEELRENMTEAISEAYFVSDRYPRPEASDAE